MMDADLLDALARDLDGSFDRLVLAYGGLLVGVARRLGARPEDAEEVAQDVFVRAHRAMRSYPDERIRSLRLRPWLVRITLNVLRNRVRRREPASVVIDDSPAAWELPGPGDASERALRHDEARFWETLLASLPASYRAPVVLRHVEGLSYPEIADALGAPVGTVKARVHRGVALLRDRLRSMDPERAPDGVAACTARERRVSA